MPWQESDRIRERRRFIKLSLQKEWPLTQLCAEFGIAPKTGYKWLGRFEEGGLSGLVDRSRAPLHPAKAMSPPVMEAVLALRRAHMTWGPRQLKKRLEATRPKAKWPAASSIGALLKREGLTVKRRAKRHTPPYSQPFGQCEAANAVWCADFKGWFRTGDGQPCYPFTLMDAHTRYLLRCQAMPDQRGEPLIPILTAVFREQGLPEAIRTDNGAPFASTGLGGLSQLSVWWIKLGIRPERIRPGKPQENGRLERLHRTLKQETAKPPRPNRRAQQEAFDWFLGDYNYDRPHGALEARPPAKFYRPSPRRFPLILPEVQYPTEMTVRQVRSTGEIKWKGTLLYVSEALKGEPVGLLPLDDRYWQLYFSFLPLAILDDHSKTFQKTSKRASRRGGVTSASRTGEGLPCSVEDPTLKEKVLPMFPV